jgi:hypothetical protein
MKSSPNTQSPPSQGDPSPWGDLQDSRLIWAKGMLFFLLGCLSAAVLIARVAGWTETVLLCITVWAFCRAYYFAFYVIQHYVDAEYRFDGLVSFVRYSLSRRRPKA